MPKAIVSLTFDDGLRCHFERALPTLNRYGFAATFFVVANCDPVHTDGYQHPDWHKIDWSLNDIQLLKDVVKQGHEVGSHSVTHRLPELNRNPTNEAEVSKTWIESRLESEVSSYCYPFTLCTDSIKKAVIDAGYKQARWGANEEYYRLENPLDRFKVDCRHIGKYGTEDVGRWFRPDCWHVLMFHGIGTESDGWWPISVEEFDRQMAELARHRESGIVEVVTFEGGAAHIA